MADALFRERLIAIQSRVAACADGNQAAVLGDEAVAMAKQLSEAVAEDESRAGSARAKLALFWWSGFWALPAGQNLTELRAAHWPVREHAL